MPKVKEKKKTSPKVDPGGLCVSAPMLDLSVIDDNACRCGCCHEKIAKKGGVCMGKPLPALGILPIHVCQSCIMIAAAFIASAKEGLI